MSSPTQEWSGGLKMPPPLIYLYRPMSTWQFSENTSSTKWECEFKFKNQNQRGQVKDNLVLLLFTWPFKQRSSALPLNFRIWIQCFSEKTFASPAKVFKGETTQKLDARNAASVISRHWLILPNTVSIYGDLWILDTLLGIKNMYIYICKKWRPFSHAIKWLKFISSSLLCFGHRWNTISSDPASTIPERDSAAKRLPPYSHISSNLGHLLWFR